MTSMRGIHVRSLSLHSLISITYLNYSYLFLYLNMEMQIFTLFPHLPIELRNQIWTHSIQPRLISLSSNPKTSYQLPTILQVSHESRTLALLFYNKITQDEPSSSMTQPGIYVSFTHDTFFQPCSTGTQNLVRHFRPDPLYPSILPQIKHLALGVSLGRILWPNFHTSTFSIYVERLFGKLLCECYSLEELLFLEPDKNTKYGYSRSQTENAPDMRDLVFVDCDVADALIQDTASSEIQQEQIQELQRSINGNNFSKALEMTYEKILRGQKERWEMKNEGHWSMPRIKCVQPIHKDSVDELMEDRRGYWQKEEDRKTKLL